MTPKGFNWCCNRCCNWLFFLLVLAAYSVAALSAEVHADGPDQTRTLTEDEALAESRKISRALLKATRARLDSYWVEGGETRAIDGCSVLAPFLTRQYRVDTGYYVMRVSLKNRNPANTPDPYERGVLEKFEQMKKDGVFEEGFEDYRVVSERDGRLFRYMKPIVTGWTCLKCHGPKSEISLEVREVLEREYPEDLATGYEPGEVRGAISIKIPVQ